jgi:pimeloyl-ACP methyl ester carboxylesterase
MLTIKINDLEMHYTERGDGPPLVALHAATANSVLMGWLADWLADKEGFNVITPDQRGHGKTTNPAPDLHLPRLVDDLIEFLYYLGRGPVHGFGYSMGGGVLLYAAKRQPDLFKSLALMGTNYHHATQERVISVVGTPDQREGMVKKVFDAETGIRNGWDAPAGSFSTIPLPTLIITADQDEFNDVEENVELFRAMPKADLLVVPHSDHLGLVRNPHVLQGLHDFYGHVQR